MGTGEVLARKEVDVETSSTGRKTRGRKRRNEKEARVASNAAGRKAVSDLHEKADL